MIVAVAANESVSLAWPAQRQDQATDFHLHQPGAEALGGLALGI